MYLNEHNTHAFFFNIISYTNLRFWYFKSSISTISLFLIFQFLNCVMPHSQYPCTDLTRNSNNSGMWGIYKSMFHLLAGILGNKHENSGFRTLLNAILLFSGKKSNLTFSSCLRDFNLNAFSCALLLFFFFHPFFFLPFLWHEVEMHDMLRVRMRWMQDLMKPGSFAIKTTCQSFARVTSWLLCLAGVILKLRGGWFQLPFY